MTARRAPRLTMSHPWRSETPLAERMLQALGAQPTFADAVLGDLAEERARRTREQGARMARWWYAREALRSAPHLLWNAVRHGGAQGRVRAALALAAVAFVPTMVTFIFLREAPPARLVVDGQRGGWDGIVLNTTHPVRLTMHVFDEKGRPLPPRPIRFERVAGAAAYIAPDGVVTCTEGGDANVRATLGKITTTVRILCRPVKEFRTQMWLQLVAGGPGRDLHFTAFGPDGRPVELLAGDLRIMDSSVARLRGSHLTPVAPGRTLVTMRIADAQTMTSVGVYEPVRTLEEARPDQRFVSAPLTLSRRDTIRWALPVGMLHLFYEPIDVDQGVPRIVANGPVMCMPDFGPALMFTSCLVRGPGASIRITHPGGRTQTVSGHLALEREEQP
jgi:hypothetical protein